MSRRLAFSLAGALVALAACQPAAPKKSDKSPVVAKGQGIEVTADEFKARLDEQSPFIRSRYQSIERKKEFLDNLIRFEVLAREAEKQGLQNDPDVQNTMKKIMVQKLVQKNFADADAAKQMPEPELQAYYDAHKSDYYRARKVRLAAVVWNAPGGTPERTKDLAAAKKALAKLRAEEKKNALAFSQVVNEFSEDVASKASSGDLNFKTRDELEQTYSKPFAETAFALKPGETSGVIETANGLYIVKATGEQQELNRTFEQVKNQIANKLFREKKTAEFDGWLKKLRDDAKITVDEKALEAVEVAAGPQPAGMPGMQGHGMGDPGAAPARPMAAPNAAPNAAPSAAPGGAAHGPNDGHGH